MDALLASRGLELMEDDNAGCYEEQEQMAVDNGNEADYDDQEQDQERAELWVSELMCGGMGLKNGIGLASALALIRSATNTSSSTAMAQRSTWCLQMPRATWEQKPEDQVMEDMVVEEVEEVELELEEPHPGYPMLGL
jgi:hypothetical protein